MIKRFKNLVNHPLFSGSAIMFVGNMGANVINYGYHLIMGRMLGPIDYGVLASLYSVIYLISIIPSSASVSIVKFISSARNSEIYSTYKVINNMIVKLALILSIFMATSSPFIAKFLHINNILSVFLITPILYISLLTLVNQSTSQGLLKFIGSVIPTLLSATLKLLIGVAFVLIGWSISGAMLAITIGLLVAYLYSHKYIKKHIKITKLLKVDIKPFLKYSEPVIIQSLAFTSIFTTDVLLVKHFLSPFDAGLYAALSTLGKIIFFAASPVAAAMFPVIAKRKSLNQNYTKIFLISFVITFLIAGSAALIFWLFPDLTIGLLYGNKYLSARTDLVWMGIFMFFYTLSNLLVNFYLSVGNTKIIFIPFTAALIQAITIWFNHDSITEVIHVSWIVTALMFVCLSIYTGYNLKYETKENL